MSSIRILLSHYRNCPNKSRIFHIVLDLVSKMLCVIKKKHQGSRFIESLLQSCHKHKNVMFSEVKNKGNIRNYYTNLVTLVKRQLFSSI